MDYKQRLQSLWVDRVIWIRHYIGSLMLGLRDFNHVALRAFRNSTDLTALYTHFYGTEEAGEIEALLNQNILILSEIASTKRMGGDIAPLEKRWADNTEHLITAIARANPHIDQTALRKASHEKFQMELKLIDYLLKEDFGPSIAIYDDLHENALKITNIIIDAIESQFGTQIA